MKFPVQVYVYMFWFRVILGVTISDTYDLNGVIPPSAPFERSYSGPNALLGDIPTRTVTTSAGPIL